MSWSRTLKVRQTLRAQLESGEEIALLFSDLRGFTTYTARKGDRAAYQLTQLHEGILRERIDEYGMLVKSLGDGVMAAFETPDVAIRAAVAIQEAIRARNHESPDEPIDVGIGISSGQPVMTDIDFIGHAVNLAQRLSALAKGGQILVTERVRELVALDEGSFYTSMGPQDLKGVGAERVVEVAWMKEVARISDAADRLTLILTERGTIVVELAKDTKQDIRDALDHLQAARAEEDGVFSAFLQRAIARFTQRLIGASLGVFGMKREQAVDSVRLSLQGSTLLVETPDGTFPLRGVDREDASEFVEKAKQLQAERKQTDP
jgi:class 3 adenylate cyclase